LGWFLLQLCRVVGVVVVGGVGVPLWVPWQWGGVVLVSWLQIPVGVWGSWHGVGVVDWQDRQWFQWQCKKLEGSCTTPWVVRGGMLLVALLLGGGE